MTAISLKSIAHKIAHKLRLGEDDALWLFEKAPLADLGSLANQVNLQKNGHAVFYNVNRHINPTNICALSCKFCAYSKKIGEEGGYAYEIDEMITKAGEAIAQGATELHMVGGLHPRWGFQRYVDMIAALRQAYPEVHLKAFTAVELDWMARKARKTIQEVIEDLRNAGLNSFPGGGAEIFHPEIRDVICDTKVSAEQWIDTHRTAHKMGMRSNCTMLYGHIERYEHRVDHMRYLRSLQDETHGFNVFIPLAFQPFQNEMGVNRYTFGADDLRTIAVARLYLDNFKHIKSYWVMLGQDIAQLALSFGANDLDGTVLEEKISRAAGGRSGMIMTRSNLENLIRRSGRIPVERTTLYEPIRESDRQHLKPVTETDEAVARMLLDRMADQSLLTRHEIWQLLTVAPLMQLSDAVSGLKLDPSTPRKELTLREVIDIDGAAALASGDVSHFVLSQIDQSASHSIAATSSGIDIRLGLETVPAEKLKSLISSVHEAAPYSSLTLRCVGKFENAAKLEDMKLTEWLASLQTLMVRSVEDFTAQGATDMTDCSEILKAAVSADLRASTALLVGTKNGEPDWARFADDLVCIRAAFTNSLGMIDVVVGRRPDSEALMPSEFMKCLAVTRLTLGTEASILTDPALAPSLAPAQGLGADKSHHPVMKLLSVVSSFGANGLGAVSLGSLNIFRMFEDMKASGEMAQLVDFANRTLELRLDKKELLSQSRHIPESAY